MKKLVLVIILFAIIIFTVANYFFIAHFSNPHITATPTSMIPVSQTGTQTQSPFCQQNQLSADVMAQGAAGNIYATLTLTNKGKHSCQVVLGNTITAVFNAKNIIANYKQNVSSSDIILIPGTKLYSQVHFPNGPQCQSSITPQPISFVYKTTQTSVIFQSTWSGKKLIVQACSSPVEKTVIDIWPLSQTPIRP